MEGDGFWTDHAPDAVQDLMQIVRCRLRRGVWPQGIDDHVAVQPVAGSEGKELYQRFGFAQPPMIFEGLPADRDRETAQQRDLKVCYGRGLFHRRIFPRLAQKREGFCQDVPSSALSSSKGSPHIVDSMLGNVRLG